MTNKPARPRNIADDIVDAVETATRKWTRQKKSEERHPGMIRYRSSRMTKEPRTTQKEAAWQIMKDAYLAASGNGRLPAKARQIYYQARPKIMAMTDDKELQYGYFSQTLLPDYIEEHGVDWNVVYDARGHFEEPHTNRRIGCGTIEVGNYLHAMKDDPKVIAADFEDASVSIIGPSGGFGAVLFCEKEGFDPLFKAVNLANRYDLMIISTKGVSVTAARQLIDNICGDNHLPLFALHDFDVAGFLILGTLQRDTRRYQFSSAVEVIDLGLRLADIEGLEQEPAAATRTSADMLRDQLAENGATDAEIAILLDDRVELNAMTSDALIAMIKRKLKQHGLKKVIPDDDLLGEAYLAFHRSNELRKQFEELEKEFEESEIKVPKNLKNRVGAILKKHPDLRWDDAIQIALDETRLDAVRAEKQKAKRKSGDFTETDDEDEVAAILKASK
jgi:Topoisomerase 6 subunit A/Spo11, Toprim domain